MLSFMLAVLVNLALEKQESVLICVGMESRVVFDRAVVCAKLVAMIFYTRTAAECWCANVFLSIGGRDFFNLAMAFLSQ
jgi:hypothetical protein